MAGWKVFRGQGEGSYRNFWREPARKSCRGCGRLTTGRFAFATETPFVICAFCEAVGWDDGEWLQAVSA